MQALRKLHFQRSRKNVPFLAVREGLKDQYSLIDYLHIAKAHATPDIFLFAIFSNREGEGGGGGGTLLYEKSMTIGKGIYLY